MDYLSYVPIFPSAIFSALAHLIKYVCLVISVYHIQRYHQSAVQFNLLGEGHFRTYNQTTLLGAGSSFDLVKP